MIDYRDGLAINIASKFEEKTVAHLMKKLSWPSDKARTWYDTSHPAFGGISPRYMMESGRVGKVVEFIDSAIRLTTKLKGETNGSKEESKEGY